MIERLQGLVAAVVDESRASRLIADADVDATTLEVEDVTDFADGGGALRADGTVLEYLSVDDDAATIELTEPLVDALTAETLIEVYPTAVDRYAHVRINDAFENEGDVVMARVPAGLYEKLPLGVRDSGVAEWVEIVGLDGDFEVRDLPARAPAMSTGTFGARLVVDFDTGRIELYDDAGTMTVLLDGATGDATFTGRVEGSTIVGSEIWFPSDDEAVGRTRIWDATGSGAGYFARYKGGETGYRAFFAVGDENAVMDVDEDRSASDSRRIQVAADTQGLDSEPAFIVFLRNDGDTDFEAASFRRVGDDVHLVGAVNLVGWQRSAQYQGNIDVNTVSVTADGTRSCSASVTFPFTYSAAPKLIIGGISGGSSARRVCFGGSLSTTGFTQNHSAPDAAETLTNGHAATNAWQTVALP